MFMNVVSGKMIECFFYLLTFIKVYVFVSGCLIVLYNRL